MEIKRILSLLDIEAIESIDITYIDSLGNLKRIKLDIDIEDYVNKGRS